MGEGEIDVCTWFGAPTIHRRHTLHNHAEVFLLVRAPRLIPCPYYGWSLLIGSRKVPLNMECCSFQKVYNRIQDQVTPKSTILLTKRKNYGPYGLTLCYGYKL